MLMRTLLIATVATLAAAVAADKATADQGAITRSIQTALSQAGCNPGAIDGSWGQASQRALERFALHAKVVLPSQAVSAETLKLLEQRPGRVCPQAVRSTARRNQQQPAKPEQKKQARRQTCPKGQILNAAGSCVTQGMGAYYFDCEFKSDGC